ncbi:terminase small subunit [Acinetobacter lwoffii]|uniref:terminase small subunit n=1 Tax=Acinetobacter lwoffii TaxID=28090 RepID=UPI003F8D6C30
MTDKQRRFVDKYLIGLNAIQAAIRAGYSEKTARSIGQRLLTNVDIQKAIEEAINLSLVVLYDFLILS